jgi:hypothetical protein
LEALLHGDGKRIAAFRERIAGCGSP